MKEFKLNIVGHSADLKTVPTGSKDTGIFFPQELIDFLGSEVNLSFTIYKEDCAKALASIISSLPLYSNNGGKIITHSNVFEECSNLYSMIANYFGDAETASYGVFSLTETTGGRRYLYGLEQRGFSIRKLLLANYSSLLFQKEDDGNLVLRFFTYMPDDTVRKSLEKPLVENYLQSKDLQGAKFQQIFYGAPGTGKSHKIKDDVNVKASEEKNLVFRTTFHPDSDYSTFVGAYKPTVSKKAVRNVAGDIVKNTDKEEVYEDCITYSFVPQAFLQAYVAAWNNPDENVYLVIEEINRGNCAQIFGDLFQLLDRDCDGFSEYPIMADKDLATYLNGIDEKGQDVLTNKDGIKDGKLRLPNNLYIWATMNTSDQSLFPIDSAFKRRWEWVYMPIDTRKENWYIQVGDSRYSWTDFLNKVNDELLTDETAEDKHLGFYFCKAVNGIISKETFVAKVLFYLWTDVFKVYGVPSAIGSGKEWSFAKFYNPDGSVNEAKVKELMAKLQIEVVASTSTEDGTIDVEVMEASIDANNNKNHLKEVRFPDGVTYDTSVNAFDAYIKSIEKTGVEKVASVADQLKYRRLGRPLISTEKYSELDNNGGYSYHQIGNYYFVRGAKTYTYVRILEDLNDMLGVGMTIVCE